MEVVEPERTENLVLPDGVKEDEGKKEEAQSKEERKTAAVT